MLGKLPSAPPVPGSSTVLVVSLVWRKSTNSYCQYCISNFPLLSDWTNIYQNNKSPILQCQSATPYLYLQYLFWKNRGYFCTHDEPYLKAGLYFFFAT